MSIHTFTLSTIRAEVRRRLNESGVEGNWTDSELNTRANRAVLKVAIDTETPSSEATVNLRQHVAWYPMPTNVLLPLFLYGPSIWENARLFPTDITQLDRSDRGYLTWETAGSSRSHLFIPFSFDRFILWPPPDTTTTITMFHVPIPDTLSADGNTTDFHPNVQDLIPIYATYLALRKYDFKKAKLALGEYRQRLVVVKSEVSKTTAARPARMAGAKPFDLAHASAEYRMGGRRGYR